MMNSSAVHGLCRLCLCESNSYADIFANDGSQMLKISSIINEILDLNVSEDDGFPVFICRECLDKVVNIKLFKNQCQASKVKLHWAITKGGGVMVREESEVSGGAFEGVDADFCSVQLKVESISSLEVDSIKERRPSQEGVDDVPEGSLEQSSILRIPSVGDAFNGTASGSKGMVIQDLEQVKTVAEAVESLKLPPGRYSKFCPYCHKKFNRQDKLKYHIIQNHTKDYRHICQHCGKRFAAQFMLKRHMRVHVKRFVCQFCELTFKREDTLRSHISNKHELSSGASDDPSRGCLKDVSNRLQDPSSPMALDDPQMAPLLTVPDGTYGLLEQMQQQLPASCSDEGGQAMLQEVANACLNSWNLRLRRSGQRNASGGSVERVPSVLGAVAEEGKEMWSSTGQENVTTPPNAVAKGNAGSVAEVGGGVAGRVSACTAVPAAASAPHSALWNEVQSDFMCSLCGRGFMNEATLEKHLAKDHVKVNYAHVCQVCGYGTNKMSRLNAHLKVHLPDKPYQCSACKYRSKWESEVKKHFKKKHSKKPSGGAASFRCDVCEKTFTTKRSLRDHGFVHSGEKPFFCTLCQYRNHSKSQVKKHVIAVHGKV